MDEPDPRKSVLGAVNAKRWIGAAVGTYGAAWLLTATVGVRQVEGAVYARLVATNGGVAPGEGTFEEWMQSEGDPAKSPYPSYLAQGSSPAPFVVIVEEGITNGPLNGYGRQTVNVWLLGLVRQLSTRRAWIA